MTKLGSGCTLVEISKALGYYANPILLSKLGSHPNLNKWSRCKFVGYAGPSKDTVEELEQWMDQIGWGLEMASVGPMNTDEQMYGSALTLSKGECWTYSGHTPTAEMPLRMADMRHYNSAAECPYLPVELSYYVPGVDGHYGPVMELTFLKNQSPNVEINPYNKSTLHGNYYIVYRKSGTTLGYSAATTPVIEAFTGLTSSRISGQTITPGDYEACALIKRGGGEGEIYVLPETYITFNLRNMSEEEFAGFQLTNMCSMTRRSAGSATGDLFVKFRLRNITDEAISASASCRVYDNKAQDPNEPFQYATITVTIPANGSVDVWGNENGQLTTTQQEAIKVEDINSMTLPIMSTCTATNLNKGSVTMTRSATLLES